MKPKYITIYDAGPKYPNDRYTVICKAKAYSFHRPLDSRPWRLAWCCNSAGRGYHQELCLADCRGSLGHTIPWDLAPEGVRSTALNMIHTAKQA